MKVNSLKQEIEKAIVEHQKILEEREYLEEIKSAKVYDLLYPLAGKRYSPSITIIQAD